MSTLIIDNYDSFTYNLAHMIADPLVIRNDEMTWHQISQLKFDRVIISPGPGRPDRESDFGVSPDVIRNAMVPVLGVCLGHQGIASVFGGIVVQGEPVHGYRCAVRHDGDELFAGIEQGFKAVRYHSLKVKEPLPDILKPIAWSEDGTLMALRHRTRPIWGVQFHPESVLSDYGLKILQNFGADVVTGLSAHNNRAKHRDNQIPNICITYEGQRIPIPAQPSEQPEPKPFGPPQNIHYLIDKQAYIDRINQCKQWIREGETYEVCLTNKLLLETNIAPATYYRRLAKARYAAYIDLVHTQIACNSPECFLQIDVDGKIQSKPIKGTIPIGRNPNDLLSNPRFRAENLMIVDLVRNDLSKVCIPGSVHVPNLMEVETHPTLHHLVTTIEGQLRPGITPMDCIKACFPGGSMTGAPKKRTMELLRKLEPEPRGIYSGTIGYIQPDGSAELNIVIRTAIFKGSQVSIGVGGAIIADSDPEEEWAEMELKASALLKAFMPDEPLQ